jgi:hypothetical protein
MEMTSLSRATQLPTRTRSASFRSPQERQWSGYHAPCGNTSQGKSVKKISEHEVWNLFHGRQRALHHEIKESYHVLEAFRP